MAQIFFPSANTFSRVSLLTLPIVGVVLIGAAREYAASQYATRVGYAVDQSVPFSHEHHVAGLGIDCRYCHTSVEVAPFAGIPPTHTCMTCHSQIWSDAEMLQPVRDSYATGEPLVWTRVHNLPDFVFFDHSAHVSKGVGCVSCHGRVDQMPLIWKAQSLQMRWCLDCHVDPKAQVRPEYATFDMAWSAIGDERALEQAVQAQQSIASKGLTNCSTCHR